MFIHSTGHRPLAGGLPHDCIPTMKHLLFLLALPLGLHAAEPIHIGDRRELFVDHFLIETLSGTEL